MKRRDAGTRGAPAALPGQRPAASRAPVAASEAPAADGVGSNGPVIVLSYAYSGADQVQATLASGTDLACTSGTGIIPLCASAAETWLRVEARDGRAMSRLAAVTIRNLVTAQVMAILAGAGKARWCELSTAPPSTVEPFLPLFPTARFVCVHRSCLDVVRAGTQVSPWGLQGQGFMPYLLTYPGNNVAVLAAYWAACTEQLLAFEEAHRDLSHRVRYEDTLADPDDALTAIRTALQLEGVQAGEVLFGPPGQDGPAGTDAEEPQAQVPLELIPDPLRERINRLHARLGYPPLSRRTPSGS